MLGSSRVEYCLTVESSFNPVFFLYFLANPQTLPTACAFLFLFIYLEGWPSMRGLGSSLPTFFGVIRSAFLEYNSQTLKPNLCDFLRFSFSGLANFVPRKVPPDDLTFFLLLFSFPPQNSIISCNIFHLFLGKKFPKKKNRYNQTNNFTPPLTHPL